MKVYMRACRYDEWQGTEGLGWAVFDCPRYFIMDYDGVLTAIDKRTGETAYHGDDKEELQDYCQLDGNSWGQVYSD